MFRIKFDFVRINIELIFNKYEKLDLKINCNYYIDFQLVVLY